MSTGGDKNPCWRGLRCSAQEALDSLTEGVPCTWILMAQGEVKRIIPAGNRSPSLW